MHFAFTKEQKRGNGQYMCT